MRECAKCGEKFYGDPCPKCGGIGIVAEKKPMPLSSKIAGFVFCSVLMFVVGGCFYAYYNWCAAPPPKREGPVVKNSEYDASVYQVIDYLQKHLKDPRSFEAIEWSPVRESGKGFAVRCKYRAKNSFNGYEIENKVFEMNSAGAVTNVIDWMN